MLAKRLLLFLVLPALASLAFICDSGGKSNGSGGQGIKIEHENVGASTTPGAPGATLATAATPVGAPASADEVANLASNFGKVKSFKASISQTGGASAEVHGTVEYQQPDRIRVVVTGGAGLEVICIGDAYYFKQGSQNWQKAPAGSNCRGNLGPVDPKALADGINTAAADKTLNKGGTDTVNGKRCQIYAQSLPNGANFEMCVADGLPMRLVSKAQQQTVTITFSDIDKNIEIKAPI